MRLLVALALVGCKYTPPENAGTPGDGNGGDGANDGAVTGDTGDGGGDCLQQWADGTVTFGEPLIVPNISFGTIERDPWLNKDESFIYFARPGSGGDLDVNFSERAASGFFNSPQQKNSLSDNQGEDGKAAMTDDELTAIVSSNRNGSFDLFEATRATAGTTAFATFSNLNLTVINSAGDEEDPHLSGDGLRLYYAASDNTPQKIFVAERATADAAFGPGTEIPMIGDSSGDADPTLSGNERVIIFTSNRTGLGGTDLWYATREAIGQPFTAPVAVPDVNGTDNDGDAHLTPDGCHLYFVSDRAGNRDIYLAVVQ